MLFQFDFDAILKRALKSGGEFADLFFEATDSLSITSENKKIENAISGVDTGVGIRMIHKHKVSY